MTLRKGAVNPGIQSPRGFAFPPLFCCMTLNLIRIHLVQLQSPTSSVILPTHGEILTTDLAWEMTLSLH